MFLTKECDYAIRVVRALSDYEKKTVKMVCDIEHVPFNFAYKILKKLERADIVISVRGALGGYQLSRKLDNLTIFDIISAVNDNLFINECLKPGHECPHNAGGNRCNVHIKLADIQDNLITTLGDITFASLLDV